LKREVHGEEGGRGPEEELQRAVNFIKRTENLKGKENLRGVQ